MKVRSTTHPPTHPLFPSSTQPPTHPQSTHSTSSHPTHPPTHPPTSSTQVMNKRRVKAHQSEKLCWNERRILSLVDSPFVVCLKYAFTSKEDLFLILDLMRGG